MYGQYRKLNHQKVLLLKHQGLSNVQIAQRLGVTQGAVYSALRKRNTILSTDKIMTIENIYISAKDIL